jgi:IS605 OrfB family transposase
LVEPEPAEGETIALDAGVTEVFTDNAGTTYEPTFGKVLLAASEKLNKTGKARNKLNELQKKSSKHKARRICKFNLGKNKMRDRKRKGKIRVRQMISQAIHKVVKTKHPNTIITEKLDIRGKAKNKKMSRLVSYWMRGALKERLNFLALVEGFHHKQVNPAYTSQLCPTCLFVHKNNRTGDIFKCLNCGHTDPADRVAAINLFARANDPDIATNTPKSVVSSILQMRFTASLERKGGCTLATVSGRTDTYASRCQSETPPPNSFIANGRGTEMSCLLTF